MFAEKCNIEGGFAQSPLHLNKNLGAEGTWNKDAIEGRAAWLAAQAVSVWQDPALDAELLAAYKPSPTITSAN